MQTLRLGTRGSPLALAQARLVADALIKAHDRLEIEIVTLKTGGDRIQDRPLAEIGGKALWTKELDRALLAGETHLSVHSMKDVESFRPEGLGIAAMLPRADVRDKLIGAASIDALGEGAVVGTSSPRRAAQLLALRPDLDIRTFRGNVATRLARLDKGEADATLLAAAGLDRLGMSEIGTPIEIDVMLPAAAQGAVGIDARDGDEEVRRLLAAIDHRPTHRCVLAERAFVAALGGDCHSPVAAHATLDGERLVLRAQILSEDGAATVEGEAEMPLDDVAPAAALARELLDEAPESIGKLFA
ncbi:hydroxymethylbilane synthase [Sphingomicrobium lutaoense]|uniref:Porphobilinogen deaminase n=1 Tax=Sphingomicrobium lutaoense TaxID=515949 RepID=A0A839Z571_9SPHN|nr:hydroxymethylbilane synthase [Sphingomicrobium lutaoense]MBB3764762.1 hydroxymethylbilane synthase [Sphingomicrobium lutaoense]